MSELVVIAYPDEHRAEEVMATLRRLRSEDKILLDDATVIDKDRSGRVTLHQDEERSVKEAQHGHYGKRLIATLFPADEADDPEVDAAGQQFFDVGIDETYMRKIGEQMQPGSSAILLLVRAVTVDNVLPAVSGYGGVVLRTSLSPQQEAQLRLAVETVSDTR